MRITTARKIPLLLTPNVCSVAQARKFPGYTAENLAEKGVSACFLNQTRDSTNSPLSLGLLQIHEVAARRFCLVAADHPLVSAISENA